LAMIVHRTLENSVFALAERTDRNEAPEKKE
jgi:hypothetical protein